ncbi:MAG: hypothetical protein V4592_12505 [Bacteroidota bacterium]
MKKLILILLALCPLCLLAQTNDKLTLKDLPSFGDKNPLFILNDKKIDRAEIAGKITPEDIAEVTVLKDSPSTAPYGAEGANGVIIILTQKFAVSAYQEKFSDFSADFESYLTSHGTDDKQIVYLIDNVEVPKDKTEALKLYHLPKEKIESVVFIQDQPEGSKILGKIAITTKK